METRFRRHGVALAAGLVVLLDRGGDLGVHVLGFGVVAAHQALQLGELADHAGDEVGLAQFGGAAGEVGLGVDGAGDLAGQLLDALDAVPLGAELLVERDGLQLEVHGLAGAASGPAPRRTWRRTGGRG